MTMVRVQLRDGEVGRKSTLGRRGFGVRSSWMALPIDCGPV